MLLSGDFGGTKTILALFKENNNKLLLVCEEKFASNSISDPEKAVLSFLNKFSPNKNNITSACFCFAGPIENNSCHMVNLNLTINLEKLRNHLDFIPNVSFTNDLVALAKGIFELESDDLCMLNQETLNPDFASSTISFNLNSTQNIAVIAPGTGLGESLVLANGNIVPTEGGHCDFAPQTELEIELWRFLKAKFEHVSYERILCGPGIVNIYNFLRHYDFSHKEITSVNPLAAKMPEQLTPADITKKALAKSCPLCVQALNIFVSILGSESGNLALKSLSLDGVYLGGGIPPKILPKLLDGTFMKSFLAKGRFSPLMHKIPVYVILNERTPLLGAARFAAEKK
ncbi:MAG: glucokinase [Eubacteriales bacterium]